MMAAPDQRYLERNEIVIDTHPDLSKERSGRKRIEQKRRWKKYGRLTKKKSHQPRGFRKFDNGGNHTGFVELKKGVNWAFAEAIRPYFLNNATGKIAINSLVIKLIPSGSDATLVGADGKFDIPELGQRLYEVEFLLNSVSELVLGFDDELYLVFAVSPFQLTDSNARIIKMSQNLLRDLSIILHDLGIDNEAHTDFTQWIPNYKRKKYLVQDNDIRRKIDNNRVNLIGQLLTYTSKYPAVIEELENLKPLRLLTGVHMNTEKKLANLFHYLQEHEHFTGSKSALRLIMGGMARDTFDKLWDQQIAWLSWNYLDPSRPKKGIQCSLNLGNARFKDYQKRASNLCLSSYQRASKGDTCLNVCPPEEVRDGKRNEFVYKTAADLRLLGISKPESLTLMAEIVKRVPGWQESDNCTSKLPGIVESIYNAKLRREAKARQQGTIVKPLPLNIMPYWLQRALNNPTEDLRSKDSGKLPRNPCRRDNTSYLSLYDTGVISRSIALLDQSADLEQKNSSFLSLEAVGPSTSGEAARCAAAHQESIVAGTFVGVMEAGEIGGSVSALGLGLVKGGRIRSQLVFDSATELSRILLTNTISPFLFSGEVRTTEASVSTRLLALDFDDGRLSLAEAQRIFAPYCHVIGTTRNHQKEKILKSGVRPATDRFRVILFFSQELDTFSYQAVWQRFRSVLPIDSSCCDTARIYFPITSVISVNERGWFLNGKIVERN